MIADDLKGLFPMRAKILQHDPSHLFEIDFTFIRHQPGRIADDGLEFRDLLGDQSAGFLFRFLSAREIVTILVV